MRGLNLPPQIVFLRLSPAKSIYADIE